MVKSPKSEGFNGKIWENHRTKWRFQWENGLFLDGLPVYLLKMVIFHGKLLNNQMVSGVSMEKTSMNAGCFIANFDENVGKSSS